MRNSRRGPFQPSNLLTNIPAAYIIILRYFSPEFYEYITMAEF